MKKLLAILLALTLALTLVPTLAFAQNEDGAEPGIVEESKETPTEAPEGETTEESKEEPKEEPQENPEDKTEGETKEEPKEEGKEETKEESEDKLEDTGDVQAAPQNGDPATTLTGDGTAGNPYKISTAADLKQFRDIVNGLYERTPNPDACAELKANINLNNDQWTPIGTIDKPYSGTFNGNGHTISGLYVTGSVSAGLFGYTSGTIQNLAVTGSVSGTQYAGSIAGYAKGGSITGCVSLCSVSASGSDGDDVYAGGIVGYLTDDSTVKNCANLKAIRADGSGNAYAGGIAGYMVEYPKISGCYNVGSITGSVTGSFTGSIAGYADNGVIANCRWLVGTAEKIASGWPSIDYNYDSCHIAKTKAHFAEGTVQQLLLKKGDTGDSPWKTTGYLAAADMTVPLLEWQTADNHTCNTDGVLGGCTCGITGKGTEDAPYEITTAEDLKAFRDLVNGDQLLVRDDFETKARCAKLMADIVLNDGTFDEDGNWSESGTPYQWESIIGYTDTFNGDGYTIKGLYVKYDSGIRSGLFAEIGEATIQNVTVTGYISTNAEAGGIVGYVSATSGSATIENCVNYCTVQSRGTAGGIVGYLSYGTLEISDCANYGTVIGNNAGGIVGYGSSDAEKISFQRCLSTGRVEGGSSSGGIAGQIRINSSLTDCINTGAVTGTNSNACVGGIVGGFFSSGDGTMTSCYSVGTVTVPEGAASGGLIGEVGNRYTLPATNCYWLKDTANRAVGESSEDSGTFAMTKAQFADGTVLNQLKRNSLNSPWAETGYLAAAGMSLPLLDWQQADSHTHTEKTGNCRDGIYCECGYLMHAATSEHDWSAWQHQTTSHSRGCNNPGCGMTQSDNCSGGTATCTQQAVCAVCHGSYGEKDPTNHSGKLEWTRNATGHQQAWSCCHVVTVATAEHTWKNGACETCGYGCQHSGGTATCTEQATCEICGEKYGALEAHSYSTAWSTDDAEHWHECTVCGAKTDETKHADTDKDHKCDLCGKTLSQHSGGTATCKDQAKCSICGAAYGQLDPSNHANLKHVDAKRATTRAEGNIEYWYCDGCGKYFKDEAAAKEITQADTVIAKKRRTNSDSTDSTGSTADKTVKSSQTGDPGVMLYVGLAAMSLTGGAWLRRKKH